jgi:hypothetical protein
MSLRLHPRLKYDSWIDLSGPFADLPHIGEFEPRNEWLLPTISGSYQLVMASNESRHRSPSTI